MGFWLSKLWNKLRGDREYKVLLLGLANAGKTTLLYRLSLGEVVSAHPTIGSNVEEVVEGNVRLQVWDLGGQESLRPSWSAYFTSTAAIIFVVDSSDPVNALLAKMELFNLLLHPELRSIPVLILANKQDLPTARSPALISEELNLTAILDRPWHLEPCSALTAAGLDSALTWLTESLNRT
jgi:ADP-ribosylation factor-like protein 5B